MFLPCMEIHSGVAVWKEQMQQWFLYLLECQHRRGRISWSGLKAAWNLGIGALSQGKSFSPSVHLFSLWEKYNSTLYGFSWQTNKEQNNHNNVKSWEMLHLHRTEDGTMHIFNVEADTDLLFWGHGGQTEWVSTWTSLDKNVSHTPIVYEVNRTRILRTL